MSGVVVWWWLSVNAFCSWVVLCWYILKFFLWMFVFLLFLCLFSLFLFVQSFSQDHTGFFFSSKTEKKLSSELSGLKAELDLCQAKMEAERQTHQKEEQALHARVVEAEKQRDAAI